MFLEIGTFIENRIVDIFFDKHYMVLKSDMQN